MSRASRIADAAEWMIGHRLTRLVCASCCLFLVTVVPLAAADPTAANVGFALLTGVTVTAERDATRVHIKTSSLVTYEAVLVVLLDESSRLTIDFQNTSYVWRPTPLAVATGLVKQIGGSQYRKGVARIVIELTRPAEYAIRNEVGGVSIIIPTEPVPEAVDPPPSLPWAPMLPAAARDSRDLLNLERLKRTLAQVKIGPTPPEAPAPVTPPPGAPPPPPAGRRETVALTLNESIDLALKRNYDLRRTSLATQSVGLDIPKARARFHPTVGFVMTASGLTTVPEAAAVTTQFTQRLTPLATQALPTGGALVLSSDFSRVETHPSTPSTGFSSTVTLSLVQPVLRGGRIYVGTQQIRNAEFDSRSAEDALKAQILQVRARTTAAYYGVLLAEKVIGVTEVAIDRDKSLVAASQALFQARMVTKRDVFSAELSLAQDSARLVSAQADLETAKNALAEILGLPIDTDVVLVDKEIQFTPVRVEQERLIAIAVEQRPELASIQEQLAKSALNVRVARNALLAQLDFVASYGRAHSRPTFSRSLDLSGDVWSVGLVFNYPLGNVAARATLAQAEIAQSRLELARIQTTRQIELEVRAAVIKLQKSVERLKALTVAIEQAKGKLEVGKAQFALGQATNLDITDAQQAILNAETDLLTAIVDYNIGLADLEASIGGPLPAQ